MERIAPEVVGRIMNLSKGKKNETMKKKKKKIVMKRKRIPLQQCKEVSESNLLDLMNPSLCNTQNIYIEECLFGVYNILMML